MIDPSPKMLFGRRKGRSLGKQRSSLMGDLLPKLSIELADSPLDPIKLFNSATNIWLEIGFGAGEHIATQAERNPNIGMIGCETFYNGVASLLSLIAKKSLTNIRIYPDDARELIRHLPNQSIDRAFILFPDPWPKKRHHKRRLISKQFLEEISRVLKDGAQLIIASDDRDYVEHILKRLRDNPHFILPAGGQRHTPPNNWSETRYEKRAKQLENNCTYLIVDNCR